MKILVNYWDGIMMSNHLNSKVNEMKQKINEENTRDLTRMGARERMELVALLTAWNNNGLPDGFGDDEVTFEFNPNSGYVFLTNSEYQAAMESDGKLYIWHNTPYSGLEGSIEDIMAENEPDSMHSEDVEYVVDWVKNYGADSIPDSWQGLIDGEGGGDDEMGDEPIEDSVQPVTELRKVTDAVVNAFLQGMKKSVGNSMTDGIGYYLHGNKIAEKRDGALWITNAGWQSNTTKERLNGLPGVSIAQQKGTWYLNGQPWDGEWIEVGPIQESRRRLKEADPVYSGDASGLSDYLGKEMQIERNEDGRLHFTFDSGGWYFDTEDVGDGVAIINGSKKYKEVDEIRNIPIETADKNGVKVEDALYWLTGGNRMWRGGSDDNVLVGWDEVKADTVTKYGERVKSMINDSNTIGELMDAYDREDIKTDFIYWFMENPEWYHDTDLEDYNDTHTENYKPSVTKKQLETAASLRSMFTENMARLNIVEHRNLLKEEDGTTGFNPRSGRKWDDYTATGVAEGFEESNGLDEQVEAWAYIASRGLWRHLQGFFGRTVKNMVERGIFDAKGHIDWDMVDDMSGGGMDESVLKEYTYKPHEMSGRYVNVVPMPGGDLKLTLTDEGKEELQDMLANSENPDNIAYQENRFWDLFEDIASNSEYAYSANLGDDGFGLTSAPGIIMGNRDDNGEWEDDAEVWYFNHYALRSFLEDMMEDDGAVFTYAESDESDAPANAPTDPNQTKMDFGESKVGRAWKSKSLKEADEAGRIWVIKRYDVDVYKDSYEEGEGDHVNSWEENVGKEFKSKSEMLDYINKHIIYSDYTVDDFQFNEEYGGLETSVIVDVDNSPATEREIEQWKAGNLELYSAHYTIDIDVYVKSSFDFRTDESYQPTSFAKMSLKETYARLLNPSGHILKEAKNSTTVGKYEIYFDTDKSQAVQQPWSRGGTAFRDTITIKNTENGQRVSFKMHGSIADYNAGKPTDLMGAFGTFVREALDGMQNQSPEDVMDNFGYDNVGEARKVFRGLQQMAAKAEKLGMDEEELIDLANNELSDY